MGPGLTVVCSDPQSEFPPAGKGRGPVLPLQQVDVEGAVELFRYLASVAGVPGGQGLFPVGGVTRRSPPAKEPLQLPPPGEGQVVVGLHGPGIFQQQADLPAPAILEEEVGLVKAPARGAHQHLPAPVRPAYHEEGLPAGASEPAAGGGMELGSEPIGQFRQSHNGIPPYAKPMVRRPGRPPHTGASKSSASRSPTSMEDTRSGPARTKRLA